MTGMLMTRTMAPRTPQPRGESFSGATHCSSPASSAAAAFSDEGSDSSFSFLRVCAMAGRAGRYQLRASWETGFSGTSLPLGGVVLPPLLQGPLLLFGLFLPGAFDAEAFCVFGRGPDEDLVD